MPQNLTNFAAALKENYGPGWKNSLNNSSALWAEVGTNTDDIIGSEAVWSIHTGRSSSTGNRAESAALPTADRQRTSKARRGLVYMYHTIKVTGPARHLSRGDEGAFIRALELEVKAGERDTKQDLSRQTAGQALTVNGALTTGVLATLSADPGTGTTLTVGAEDASIMRHFFAGMKISLVNPADGAIRTQPTDGYEVVSVTTATRVITIATAADTVIASGDFIVRTGNLGNEIDGLRFLLGTSTYAGINPATVPSWQAVQVGSATTGISEVILDEAQESVETDGGGMIPELMLCEHAQRRKLASLLQAQKRYDGRDVTLTSGWKGLSVARGVLVADRFMPTSRVFGVNKADISKFVGLEFQWDEDDDGGVFYKALDGSDAVEARFKGYHQLAATVRNGAFNLLLAAPTF